MGFAAGPTILRWGRSRTPIGPSSPVSRDGCVDGCASNTRSAAADVIGSRTSTCTIGWAWFVSETSCTTFRGRTLEHLVREPSAEIRSLGSMRRDVETESWRLDCGTAIRKGRQQLRGAYRYRA